jgi:SAM-dependent methyltransferase
MKKLMVVTVSALLGFGCAAKSKPDEEETVEQSVQKADGSDSGESSESDESSDTGEPAAQPESNPGEHQHRGHRFDEPEKYAKRWNDPARNAWQKPKEVIELMGVEPGMTVADIGTGTGYFIPFLSEAVGPKGKVWGLDIEAEMVKYVTELAAEEGLENVEAKQVKPDGPGISGVDRFLTVNTWHHIGNRKAYAAKLAEALNPGGAVIIVDYRKDAEMKHGPPMRMRLAPSEVVEELEAGGLQAEIAEETLPRQYIVIGRKP